MEQGAGYSGTEVGRRRRDGLGRAGKVLRPTPAVLETVAPLPGEEALYGQFRVLLATAASDPTIKQVSRPPLKPSRKSLGHFWSGSTTGVRPAMAGIAMLEDQL